MNISTGGPHILLFERDQQLATLLVSELQLAGYTNHTARTAVEVFDAIARYPVRLVLVNLAQAAAARREFWVALDSQRRDRKVQVLTFLCTNLAGYGPRDLDDRSSTAIPDIEVDGMMGLMNLVDAVRTRIPNENVEANTLPRIPKVAPPTSSSTPSTLRTQQPSAPGIGSTAAYRPTADVNAQQAATRTYPTPLPPNSTSYTPPASPAPYQTNPNQYATQAPAQGTTANGQSGYTEKIRAVLYPNQRTWSAQGTNSYAAPQENREPTTYASRSYNSSTLPGPSDSALQRLASGQAAEGGNESGLAQLSRMAQGYRSPLEENNESLYTPVEPAMQSANTRLANTTYQPEATQPVNTRLSSTTYQPEATQPTIPYATPSTVTYTQQTEVSTSAPLMYPPIETNSLNNDLNTVYTAYVSPSTRPTQVNENSSTQTNTISTQTLRASPIQDMPIERTAAPASPESTKRPDVLSRANYGQQLAQIAQQLQTLQQAQPASSPLASIATSMPSGATASREAPITAPQPPLPPIQEETPKDFREVERPKEPEKTEKEAEKKGTVEGERENQDSSEEKQARGADFEDGLAANNAVLLDIVQSLPPMPALAEQPPQSVQPQVLSGRATRSLGKVLLDGHLVPQDRLEVAQNIQRMLRGVDLNYQLGEILLMFKLLSHDQLLAASLVSYGLITTTQISALGRIRQELHAIGLEYDLENLLILFRILSPEQLREVRASLQS